mmetsp:Transcript_6187/g.8997  ORF Transcript_6187/g.8997 Transcript_6187/m.8997 type:complete len:185 (-) Transcript_6187:71-625(-)
MGNTIEKFSKEEIKEFELNTFFSKGEIYDLYKEWCKLGDEGETVDKTKVLTIKQVQNLKALVNNPFKEEIVSLFASSSKGQTFSDFVDMCSAFHPRASHKVKEQVAFYIFDYPTSDGAISIADLEHILTKMVGEKNMSVEDITKVTKAMFKEADLDNSEELSITEFSRITNRVPDFAKRFSFRV